MPRWTRWWRRRAAETSGLTCQEVVELVTEYLEGTLPASEHARFEAHLAACEGCTRYLEQMRATLRTLGALPVEAISADAARELMEAFRDWRSGRPPG
jgi:anti-sigma factor RsiW